MALFSIIPQYFLFSLITSYISHWLHLSLKQQMLRETNSLLAESQFSALGDSLWV